MLKAATTGDSSTTTMLVDEDLTPKRASSRRSLLGAGIHVEDKGRAVPPCRPVLQAVGVLLMHDQPAHSPR
jgi:hypothetical protein